MRLTKLSAGFGAETEDFGAPFQEVWDAFFAAQVLVFRGLELTAGGFLSFARQFGRPEPHVIDQFHHSEHADILILSNRRKDGAPVGLADAGTYFHTDYSYLDVPARCTMLYSIEVPRAGGDTLFADQYAAYDGLPEAMKRRVDGLVALHHYGNRDDLDRASRTVASVLDELKRHATQDQYRLRLEYGVGDLVIWDNASLLHSATLTDPEDPRTLWRITVKEERES